MHNGIKGYTKLSIFLLSKKLSPRPQKHYIKPIHLRELYVNFSSFLRIRFKRNLFFEGFPLISQNLTWIYPSFWDFPQTAQIFLFRFRETQKNRSSGLKPHQSFHHDFEVLSKLALSKSALPKSDHHILSKRKTCRSDDFSSERQVLYFFIFFVIR